MNYPFFRILLVLSILSVTAKAGPDYRILFQSGALTPDQNLEQFITSAEPTAGEVVNGYYYRLLQFSAIPSVERKNAVAQSGIILMDYMPHYTFVAAIPAGYNKAQLAQFGIRSVLKTEGYQKINRNLFDE